MVLSTQVLLVPTRTTGVIVQENHGGPKSGQFTKSLVHTSPQGGGSARGPWAVWGSLLG